MSFDMKRGGFAPVVGTLGFGRAWAVAAAAARFHIGETSGLLPRQVCMDPRPLTEATGGPGYVLLVARPGAGISAGIRADGSKAHSSAATGFARQLSPSGQLGKSINRNSN